MVIHATVKFNFISACANIFQHEVLDDGDCTFLANAITNAPEILAYLLRHQQGGEDVEDYEIEFVRPDGSPLVQPPPPEPEVEHTFYDEHGGQQTLESLQAKIRARINGG